MRFSIVAWGIALTAILLSGASAQLSTIHSVYLFPMAGGMEQYLANQLTSQGVFQVVTDPKRAEAVFTDRLGAEFEKRLDELIPLPQAAPPAEQKEKEEEEKESKQVREEPPGRLSTFARGKGNFFLVDARSRTVVWSTYARPENTTAEQLHRTATRIVDRLKRFLSPKQS